MVVYGVGCQCVNEQKVRKMEVERRATAQGQNVWTFTALSPSVASGQILRSVHKPHMKCAWRTAHSHILFTFSKSEHEYGKSHMQFFCVCPRLGHEAPGFSIQDFIF